MSRAPRAASLAARASRGRPTAPEPLVLVGLMSGTSADGISAAVARFLPDATGALSVELLAFLTHPYAPERRDLLLRVATGGSLAELCRLDFDLGGWLADAAVAVMAEAGVARAGIAAIASHGHTLWHEPGHSTWQLGQAAVIAERTGLSVVSGFRVRDVAAGGQGAPLVPVADAMLFSHPRAWRALQNLGGIGNVTVVPPGGDMAGVRAFDTGPGVAVIDGLTRSLFPGLPYDVDGAIARRGRPVEAVVREALDTPYFRAPPPKSTGRELFDAAYIARIREQCRAAGAGPDDTVATAVELTARSIALGLERFVPEPVSDLVLSGGGARNPALTRAIAAALAHRTPPVAVRLFEEIYFDGEAKEAVAFALLGYLHLAGLPGNVPAATGARGPRVLGSWSPA